MQRFQLVPHRDHRPLELQAIDVEIRGGSDDVLVSYRLVGHNKVIMPPWTSPARADDLWRLTCFELFLQFDDDERYVEFNFSPSTRWAAYAFDGYRDGMVPLARDVAPRIDRIPDGIVVDCDLGGLPHGALRMGLSAVIEEEGGVRSYWALAHAPGPPDFHNPACFTARLPAPRGA